MAEFFSGVDPTNKVEIDTTVNVNTGLSTFSTEDLLRLLICEMFKMNQYLSYITGENVTCDDLTGHADWPF